MNRPTIIQAGRSLPLRPDRLIVIAALAMMALAPAAQAQPVVSYFIFGQVVSDHQPQVDLETRTTAAIPGFTPAEPAPEGVGAPVPLPGVTIEAYSVDSNALLGKGQANREGFYNLNYYAPQGDHEVRFQIYLDFVDGGREFVGQVENTPAGDPIIVDNRLFQYVIQVANAEAVRAGTAIFSPSGEFVFTEVGAVDMDNIYDAQQDAPVPAGKLGLTKPPGPDHSLGPDLAFGGTLDLYGLFGELGGARYYRISWINDDIPPPPECDPSLCDHRTGSISNPLFKKNYLITGAGIEIHRIQMGPKNLVTAAGPLNGVYDLEESLVGEPITGHPGELHSNYWTELGLRAKWYTGDLIDGNYTLSVQAWDALGNPLATSTNPFATLNLHLVNTPPEARIHTIRYLGSPGAVVLSDASPCQTVVLNLISPDASDDSLQFEITAEHPTGFLRAYQLSAWHGHDMFDGVIAADTYASPAPHFSQPPPNPGYFDTPSSISYTSCAYRFHLRVWPRITNGYRIIHIRDDNWYASLSVLSPP